MDQLIIRELQGLAEEDEMNQLNDWIRESPSNQELYREISAIWYAVEDADVGTSAPAVEALLCGSGRDDVVPGRAGRPRAAWRWLWGVAAAAALLMFAGIPSERVPVPEESSYLKAIAMATAADQSALAVLSDGTIVHLGPNSQIRTVPTPGVREVWLEGRAFFGVSREGDDWPFIVRSEYGQARVLGTRFEFSTEGEQLQVVVVDGLVTFESAGQEVEVSAGQAGRATREIAPVVDDVEDVDAVLTWMGQVLVFHDTPLPQAAREIEGRFGARVEIVGDDIANQTISGGFKDRTFEEVIVSICRVIYAECSINDGVATIAARKS